MTCRDIEKALIDTMGFLEELNGITYSVFKMSGCEGHDFIVNVELDPYSGDPSGSTVTVRYTHNNQTEVASFNISRCQTTNEYLSDIQSGLECVLKERGVYFEYLIAQEL